jgi:hypothetical protein
VSCRCDALENGWSNPGNCGDEVSFCGTFAFFLHDPSDEAVATAARKGCSTHHRAGLAKQKDRQAPQMHGGRGEADTDGRERTEVAGWVVEVSSRWRPRGSRLMFLARAVPGSLPEASTDQRRAEQGSRWLVRER